MTVIDASVYVAALRENEPAHNESRAWFQRAVASGEPLAAPMVLLAEVGGALARRARSPQPAREVVEELETGELIALYPIGSDLAGRAAVLAAEHFLRGCDAIYVALAEQLGEPLVTLDEEQLARGAAVVTTIRPQ